MAYTLQVEADRLILRTTSYRAEKGSVLHSGIYSRELASSFVGAGITIVFILFWYMLSTITLTVIILAVLLFTVVFILSRLYIFKEPYLECVIDKRNGTVKVTLVRGIFKRSVKKDLKDLRDLKTTHKRFEIENPDAVAFVEKIALQHGTVLPGFGEPEEFYEVLLKFTDSEIPILAVKEKGEAEDFINKVKRFL